MRSGLAGSAFLLFLAPAIVGCAASGNGNSDGGPFYASPAYQGSAWGGAPWGYSSNYGGGARYVDCDGNDCRHNGGPDDRQQWRAQHSQQRPYDNSWAHRDPKTYSSDRQSSPGWNGGDDDWHNRSSHRTGQRAACVRRDATHEDCSQLPK